MILVKSSESSDTGKMHFVLPGEVLPKDWRFLIAIRVLNFHRRLSELYYSRLVDCSINTFSA